MTKYFRPRLLTLCVALFLPVLNAYLQFEMPSAQKRFLVIYLFSKFLQFSLPIFVRLIAKDSSFKNLFRINRDFLRQVKIGIFTGAGAIAFIFSLFYLGLQNSELVTSAAPLIQEKLQQFGASSGLTFLVLALSISLLHSFLEEYYWRSYVFHEAQTLLIANGFTRSTTLAVLISSLGFALHHFVIIYHYTGHQEFLSLLFTIPVVIAGAVWAFCMQKTGSIWAGWLSHIMADLALMWVGYEMAFR